MKTTGMQLLNWNFSEPTSLPKEHPCYQILSGSSECSFAPIQPETLALRPGFWVSGFGFQSQPRHSQADPNSLSV